MANKALAKLGWRKIWVVCYRAKNGLWYPATHMLFCSRGKADIWLKPCQRQDPEGQYKVLRYFADAIRALPLSGAEESKKEKA